MFFISRPSRVTGCLILAFITRIKDKNNRQRCSFSKATIEISEDYKNHFFYNPSEIINITVNQKTINSIIENEIQNLDKIDIVSLDIEGGELNCLYGFDLEKYKPKVLVIEDAFNNKILDEYMFKFGYKLDKHISYNKYYVYNK